MLAEDHSRFTKLLRKESQIENTQCQGNIYIPLQIISSLILNPPTPFCSAYSIWHVKYNHSCAKCKPRLPIIH